METSLPQHDAERDEEDYKATESEWNDFLRSRAWKDLEHFAKETIEVGKELLAVSYKERAIPEPDEILRGGIKVARRILEFPFLRIKELEDDRECSRTDSRESRI
jgi:hypothetical protein